MTAPTAEHPGPYLRASRQRAGLTLEAVAAEVEISAGQLSKIERGHKHPGPDVFARIAHAIGSLSRGGAA